VVAVATVFADVNPTAVDWEAAEVVDCDAALEEGTVEEAVSDL